MLPRQDGSSADSSCRFASAIRQQPAGDAFDVAGLWDRRVDRVVRALTAALEQLDVAVQMAGAGQQDVLQVVFRQVH